MRVFKLDLRLRVAIVLATVCIAVVGALGVTLYLASEEMEDALVSGIVSEEMESLIRRAETSTEPVTAGGPNLQYYVLSTPADYEKLAPRLRGLGPGHHEVGSGLDELHVAVRDVGRTRYVVAYDAGPHAVLEARFRELVLLALGTAAVISVVLGYWLAGVLTHQLSALAARVGTLAPDEAYPPLERPDHDREIAALAHALDHYHARILDMMRREQEFTANASHELRTPLTAIRTSCELLAADADASDKARTRIEMIDDAARQMTERIETLLYLARRHEQDAAEPVSLRECVEEAAAACREEIARKKLTFDDAVPEGTVVHIDRKAFQLVLANLLKNAVRYTDRGVIRVDYIGGRITVTDSGAGIAPHHMPQLFERYYRADDQPDGLGLGLAIVRRICDSLGWKIDVQSKPGAGSAFSIQLT